MIDLHSHTTESDGSSSPDDLIDLACGIGLEALAITDHDTFAGFDLAAPLAKRKGLELICGIELSTRYENRSVHLLGYFLESEPATEFRRWIVALQESRHLRNLELLAVLENKGFEISVEELKQCAGPLPGRPHIARLMMDKGYVSSTQQAFDDYLDESASCYVPRQEPGFSEAVERIRAAGGLSSLAHPGRISRDPGTITAIVADMEKKGLAAIEVFHSDHSPQDVSLYGSFAESLGLSVTGGSDFHGRRKPSIELGLGRNGNLSIPYSIVEQLHDLA